MLKHFSRAIITSLLFSFTFSAVAAPITYHFDPNHSFVLWQINHFGFSNPTGKWPVTGTLILDKEKPQNSQVKAIIDVSHMITGISELDDHLKGELFFDTKKYPTATFVSNKVLVTSKNTANISGVLTLRGVTKTITLPIKLNSIAINPIYNIETAGFSSHFTLKRSDFGITALLPGLSDTVKIDIEAEATKAQ